MPREPPAYWKLAAAAPIHKPDSRQKESNYRPVRLTSAMFKK